MWSDATLGKPDSFTSISSPVISTSSHVCFTFWFDLKVKFYCDLSETNG